MKTKTHKRRSRQRTQSHRHRHDTNQHLPPALADNPNRGLTFKEWCALNGFSPRTGRRILAGEFGPPPVVTRPSPHRITITIGNNALWQQTRERVAS